MPLPASPDIEILSDETVWDGRFKVDVVQFRSRRFDGTWSGIRCWEIMRRGKAAAVLAYDPEKDVVAVIQQFRLPALAAGLDPVLTELAAGLVDPGESSETTIRREAREEMGIELGTLLKIGEFLLTPGGCDELCTLYAGRISLDAIPEDGELGAGGLASEHEDIRVRAVDARQAIDDAVAGLYPNSVATIGLLWFGLRREQLRKEWLRT